MYGDAGLIQPNFAICTFSCFNSLAGHSSTIFNRSGGNRYHCLIPDAIGKLFTIPPLNIMLAMGFFLCIFFIRFKKFLSVPSLLKVFIIN